MSARKLLVHVYGLLVEGHGEDAVYDMLNPPTHEETRAERIAQLRALGIAINA